MGIDDPEVVTRALDLGYRHLDTAQIYGNEAVVGDGLAASDAAREDVTLATKLWVDDLGPDRVRESTEASLARLGVDAVDLLYVHRPRETYDPEATLPALANLVDDGVVGGVAVSNFTESQLATATDVLAAHGGEIAAHQTEYHPLFRRPNLLDHAREHGYPLVAYSPLSNGRAGEISAVAAVADRYDATPEAVCLAWLTGTESVVTIPKASGVDHLRANLAAPDLDLDDEAVARIEAVDREVELFPE
ncbi:MAG: aldo/keto reductase [Halolamina sp.]